MADGALTGAITGAITGGIKHIRATKLLNSMNANALDSGYDCIEIAEDLQSLNKGRGGILTFKPKSGNWIKVMEYGNVDEFTYHSVYKYGRYVIDPRYGQLSTTGQYISMLSKLNPLGIIY